MQNRMTLGLSFLKPGISLKVRFALWFASVGGAGDFPKAPGTVGSLIALFLFLPLVNQSWLIQLLAVVLVVLLGFWTSFVVGRESGVEDDQRIVIDEVAGMWITLLFFPFNIWVFVGGFLLFHVLDIVKVFPANYCDEKIEGGYGVMLDDVVSGIYANVIIRMLFHLSALL